MEFSDSYNENKWHLSKSVNLTHILTTAMMIIALFSWGNKMEVRITVLEQAILAQLHVDSRQDVSNRDGYVRVERRLDQIELKLDRVIENGANRRTFGSFNGPDEGDRAP